MAHTHTLPVCPELAAAATAMLLSQAPQAQAPGTQAEARVEMQQRRDESKRDIDSRARAWQQYPADAR